MNILLDYNNNNNFLIKYKYIIKHNYCSYFGQWPSETFALLKIYELLKLVSSLFYIFNSKLTRHEHSIF